MIEHELKVWLGFFDALISEDKPFELRKNDRNFQRGDRLRLREYAPGPDEFTGREIVRTITYVMSGDDPLGFAFGLRSGFVALGIRKSSDTSLPASGHRAPRQA
jgi:hypothetical protein